MPTTQHTETRASAPTTARDRAIAFFIEHAGYGYDQRIETPEQGQHRHAEHLADAEVWAAQNGYSFDCERDIDPDGSWIDDPNERAEWEASAWGMVMYNPDGKVCQSLWGCDGEADYKRVVRAELALEEMPNTEVTA